MKRTIGETSRTFSPVNHPDSPNLRVFGKLGGLGYLASVFLASLFLGLTLIGCEPAPVTTGPGQLNSPFNDEQPALSGDGRFLAFVSNREGSRRILLYDRQTKQYLNLPRLNRRDAIAESPSLSYSGRYIAYLASDTARPEIELYDRATQQVQILTTGYRGWFRNPKISPEGRYIVFETGNRGQWDIEVLDRGPNVELDLPNVQKGAPAPAASP